MTVDAKKLADLAESGSDECFIAAARTAIPELLAERKVLVAEVEHLRKFIQTDVIDGLTGGAFLNCDACGHGTLTEDMDVVDAGREALKAHTRSAGT